MPTRQCQFHVIGCQYVGAGTDLKYHLGQCSFDEKNKKIKCQHISCKKQVRIREMVQHLRDVHKSPEKKADSSGKIMSVARFAKTVNVNKTNWSPQICSYNNETFFLHAELYERVWTFWVSILGNEDEAKRYEVELSIPKKVGHKFSMGYRGKVFCIDENIGCVVRDRDNVLSLGNNMAEVKTSDIGEDGYRFSIDYKISCK